MSDAIQIPKRDVGPYKFILSYYDADGQQHELELGPCQSLYVSAKGYRDFYRSGGELANLAVGNDGLTLYVWADPERAVHTHKVSLHLCKEEA